MVRNIETKININHRNRGMLQARSQSNVCSEEAKFVQERIVGVEKHFAELCTIFAAFTRKAARLRDKNDEVSKVIQTYAEAEGINRSLSNGLVNFATTLSVIGDYRDAEVHRLDSKVISPLSQYELICKHVREDVKNAFAARERELNRRRQLDKLLDKNPQNRKMITQAETELIQATFEVTKVVKGLEDQIDTFEKRKLHDLKTVLLDFVKIELSFHTKAVELLTKAYQDVAEIDEAKDLEEFREVMHVPDSVSRLDTVRRTSFRQSYSLTNLANRLVNSPMSLKKSTRRPAESLDSLKGGFKNSSDSVQVEEYDKSSMESESDSVRGKSKKISKHRFYGRQPSRLDLRTVPAIPSYQKSLTSSIIHSLSYS